MNCGGRVRLKDNNVLDEDIPTLLQSVFKYISSNLELIYLGNPETGLQLRNDIILPNELCDGFVKYHQECNEDIDDLFMYIFRSPTCTPLKCVELRNSSITDNGLRILLNHKLISLSLWYCNQVTSQSWQTIIENGYQLRSLELGRDVYILKCAAPHELQPVNFQLNLPNLRKLVLNNVVLQRSVEFKHLIQLEYLDLSDCVTMEFSLEALTDLPQLKVLILFNVWPLEKQIPSICKIKTLITLDISFSKLSNGMAVYNQPDLVLSSIIENLVNLQNLDISGTNLAGTGIAQFSSESGKYSTDIPGLLGRTNNPLEFLGLYHTAGAACNRYHIPAKVITGDANEEQILVAAKAYRDRPLILTKVLNDLYHLLRYETCKSINRALEYVLIAMDRHLSVKHMQISGSATLFYIIKGREKTSLGTPLKNHIIKTLLNGMSIHLTDETMMRNSCLTLCQFSIPNDVLFEYERLVKVLLHGVADVGQEGFVQRIAIYILNSLACQVGGEQKLYLGDHGAIQTMLNLIKERLERNVFDDVMEVAWSTMWNVTDETAVNCERFLDGLGMEYFLACLRCFPEKDDLLRNMMGLLGNVAEVKHLRNRLMTTEFITVFSNLLGSCGDGIEVSYNAAGVISHIASDGPEVWTIEKPTRDDVLGRLAKAIDTWNINSERNINYRSFEPILGLLNTYETPECQHWAVWALANLTKVYPLKYCHLVEEENGLYLLNNLLNHPKPNDRIKYLAKMVIDNCSNKKNESD